MAPNTQISVQKDFCVNHTNPFKDEPSHERKSLEPDSVSGETISLGSRRRNVSRNNSDGGTSPRVGTVARLSYELDRYSKNAMLVIHNNSYELSDRTADKVKTTFEKFRFEVDVHNNKTGEEILSVLEEFFGRDFTQYGCMAVVVVSSANKDGSYATQGQSFKEEDVLKYFEKGVIPTLEGKPKIFLSEANNLYAKRHHVADFVRKRDVFEWCMPNCTDIYPPELNREILRYPLNLLCERLEDFSDCKTFLDIILMTLNETSEWTIAGHNFVQRFPIRQMSTLLKELWLWKTA